MQAIGSTTVSWEKSDMLRLSSKEARLKQFRVGVLIWKFQVQERRYKPVCLAQKTLNNRLQNRSGLHHVPSLYSGPDAETEADLATGSKTGDGGEELQPGARAQAEEIRGQTPQHAYPKALSRMLVNTATLMGTLSCGGDSGRSWSQTASSSFNQLWERSGTTRKHSHVCTESLGRDRAVHQRRPFPVSRMDKELPRGFSHCHFFLL